MGEDDDHFVVPVKRPHKTEPKPEHQGGSGGHPDHKPKHFDVAHPETTAPSPTSRPVIVSHGPLLPDPMMQAAKDDALEQDEPDRVASSNREKVVEAPAGLSAAHHEPGIEPPVPGTLHTPGTPSESVPTMPAPPESSPPADNSEAMVDSVAEQAAQRKQQEEADKELAERSAKVAELVERKTYYVPINVAKRRRSNQMMTVVGVAAVVIVVVVGVGYLLMS